MIFKNIIKLMYKYANNQLILQVYDPCRQKLGLIKNYINNHLYDFKSLFCRKMFL